MRNFENNFKKHAEINVQDTVYKDFNKEFKKNSKRIHLVVVISMYYKTDLWGNKINTYAESVGESTRTH